MAKQKKSQTSLSFDEYVQREFGDGIIINAGDIADRPRQIIPTVLSLDVALNGGIPEGTIALISGKPKAGKTSLVLQILANAQKQDRHTFYFDVERRCKPSLLDTIHDLDKNKLTFVRSTPDRTLTAEAWFQLLERTIKDHPRSVIVIDSVAALSTECEMTELIGDNKDMGGVPKLLAKFFRKMTQIIDTNNVILIFISQLMSGRNPKGAKTVEKGGWAVQYAASVWLSVNWVTQWSVDPNTQAPEGQDVHIKIMSSALGCPFLPCVLPLRFGHGFDVSRDLVCMAENFGLIEKSGAWYSVPIFDNQKWQGIKNLCDFLDTCEHGERDKLEKEVRDIILPDTKD